MDTGNAVYLSDVIDYDRDIAPYQFIKIYAGVGAGKNQFIDNLISGGVIKHQDGTPVAQQAVLLITSRRAKVDEQLDNDSIIYDPKIGMFDYCGPEAPWMLDEKYQDYYESPIITIPDCMDSGQGLNVYKRSCVYTNAKIERMVLERISPYDPSENPWERFDMIVVDEAHAILSDASYQSSPFYVRRLIEETLKQSKTCKVIAMTGTPRLLSRYSLFEKAHEINVMQECVNIVPKHIEFITSADAGRKRAKLFEQGRKYIYFFNHIEALLGFYRQIPPEKQECAVMSFSDRDKLRALKKNDEEAYNRIFSTANYLAEHQKLPDNVVAFLSTSKNKEGINIKNEDIRIMFVEEHNDVDVIQMAGRLRNGIDQLYIVTDSVGHSDIESGYEAEFSQYDKLLESLNCFLHKRYKDQGLDMDSPDEVLFNHVSRNEQAKDFLAFVHAKFPYVRFDNFTYQFVYYPERAESRKYYKEQNEIYSEASRSKAGLLQLATQWFPGVTCDCSAHLVLDNQRAVDTYLRKNHWLNGERTIRDEERRTILEELKRLTGGEGKNLGPFLKKYGYRLEVKDKKKDSNAIIRSKMGEK